LRLFLNGTSRRSPLAPSSWGRKSGDFIKWKGARTKFLNHVGDDSLVPIAPDDTGVDQRSSAHAWPSRKFFVLDGLIFSVDPLATCI